MESRNEPISLDVDQNRVAWLTFNLPDSRVNLLTAQVMRQLDRRLGELESTIATGRLVAVVLRSGKPGTFFAGADVGEIAGLTSQEEARAASGEGQRIFRRLERLTVPTVAAVDGLCLGGGTEMILACNHRIASDRSTTRFGLPEIKLGIVPGFGGCIRLPRLIGIQRALNMILSGRTLSASRAVRFGLVDRVGSYQRFDVAVDEFVAEILSGEFRERTPDVSLRDRLLENTGAGRKLLFSTVRRQTLKQSRGWYPAPLRALEVVETTLGMPVEEAMPIEAAALAEMAHTDVSRSLVRLFLLQQAAKRSLPADVMDSRRPIGKTAVLGAGVMGGSIAELIAAHDVPVVLKDIDQDALDEGLRHASDLLEKGGARGVFSREEVGLKFALISGTLSYDMFDDVDLVIEAVVERMPVKQQVLKETEERIGESAVFATNTSSLSVAELASSAEHPIRTEASTEAALADAFGFAIDVGKTPVLVADRPGFLVNRLLAPYLNEVGFLLGEGADVETVDSAMLEFGMPMGPCRLLDEIGFDVAEHVANEMSEAFGERLQPSDVVSALRREGRLGRKNERGFYAYAAGREKGVDKELRKVLSARAQGTAPSAAEIQKRCLYVLVNEAAYALAEGVVAAPDTVDLAMVLGTGFPPFRGGLLRWADTEGLAVIAEALAGFAERIGPRFAPADLLREKAEQGGTFTDIA
jgi:3-hydroxyacyl-CoA dehydrogenase/enoyl-CoA hydratase/3-hydroxybutyryl-CoA epimerase